MRLLTIFILLLLMVAPNTSRLLCGVELVTSNLMEMFVMLDCPDLLERHRKCCTDHGVCYIFRKPWKVCDRDYCGCVHKIAGKAGGICQAHGENFCKIVMDTGRNVYDYHGK